MQNHIIFDAKANTMRTTVSLDDDLYAAALELERVTRAGDWAAVAARLGDLRVACAELREAISRLSLPHP